MKTPLCFSTGLTAAGRARLASERDAAVMLGDARDATAGDGAGVNRAALVPFSNVERRVKNVTPDLAVEPLDKVGTAGPRTAPRPRGPHRLCRISTHLGCCPTGDP